MNHTTKRADKPKSYTVPAKISLLILTLCLLFTTNIHAQKAMWVGETYKCDVTSAIMGITSDVSWSTNGGYLSLSGSGFYRNVKVTQYFSGSATVKCSWKYKLYSNDMWRTQSKTWTITCNENPVSIYPTSLVLAPGETASVSYRHQYSNSYTSYANTYFSSSNNTIISVSNSGTVTALKPGTAYINVYSNISDASNPVYCTVTVKEPTPTGVSLPATLTLTVGDSKTLTPTVTPTGASTSFTWSSDNESIATVNSYGVVSGVKAGKTNIRVKTSIGGYSDFCNVTVKEPPVAPTKIEVKPAISLYPGFSFTVVPVLYPDNAETKYTYKSEDTSIATISSTGKITAKKAGTTVITITTENNLSASCELTVSDLPANLSESDITSRISIITNLINKTFNKAY